jgi:hypothetical protein
VAARGEQQQRVVLEAAQRQHLALLDAVDPTVQQAHLWGAAGLADVRRGEQLEIDRDGVLDVRRVDACQVDRRREVGGRVARRDRARHVDIERQARAGDLEADVVGTRRLLALRKHRRLGRVRVGLAGGSVAPPASGRHARARPRTDRSRVREASGADMPDI